MGTGYLHSCEFGIPYSLPKDPSYKHLTSRGKGARIRHEVYFWKHLAMVLGFTGRREATISQNKARSIFNKKCKLTQETFPFTGWATEEWEYLFFFFLEDGQEYLRILFLRNLWDLYICHLLYLLQDKMEKYLPFSSMYTSEVQIKCLSTKYVHMQISIKCKYLPRDQIFTLRGYFIFVSIFSGIGYECRITLVAFLLFFFFQNNYTFLGVCLREFGYSQRKGTLRSFLAWGNKIYFCWQLLYQK